MPYQQGDLRPPAWSAPGKETTLRFGQTAGAAAMRTLPGHESGLHMHSGCQRGTTGVAWVI